MITFDENDKLVQTSEAKCHPEEVVDRMNALISVLQRAGESEIDECPYSTYLVLEMLREQLPTIEQAEQYLKRRSKGPL